MKKRNKIQILVIGAVVLFILMMLSPATAVENTEDEKPPVRAKTPFPSKDEPEELEPVVKCRMRAKGQNDPGIE